MATGLSRQYHALLESRNHRYVDVDKLLDMSVVEYAWNAAKEDEHHHLYHHIVGVEFSGMRGQFNSTIMYIVKENQNCITRSPRAIHVDLFVCLSGCVNQRLSLRLT